MVAAAPAIKALAGAYSKAKTDVFECSFRGKVDGYKARYYFTNPSTGMKFVEEDDYKKIGQEELMNGLKFSRLSPKSNLDFIEVLISGGRESSYAFDIDRRNKTLTPVNNANFSQTRNAYR